MVGFAAVGGGPRRALIPADGEIEEARWVTRAQVRAALAEDQPDLKLPGATSIAYQMITGWAAAG